MNDGVQKSNRACCSWETRPVFGMMLLLMALWVLIQNSGYILDL